MSDFIDVKHIYCVRYCLTSGIERRKLCRDGTNKNNGYAWVVNGPYGASFLLGPRDWALTLEDARLMAEAKRRKKLASMRKQIAKLEAMTFDVAHDA